MAGINLEGRATLVAEKERAQVVSTLKDMLELSRQSAEENAKAREAVGITESLAEPFVRDTGDMVRPEMRPVDMVPSELSDIIADESTAPLSEVDPERRADEEFLRTGQLPTKEEQKPPAKQDLVDDSLNQILISEGGFQDDKEDTGNYLPDGTLVGTNRGITPVALAEFKGVDPNSITVADIQAITEEDAREIYRKNYFDKPKIGQIPQELQASVFDMYINSGSNAIKTLQKAAGLPKNEQDGSIGPKTLSAILAANVTKEDYADARISFYKDLVKRKPKSKKYLNGWITRANKYR